MKNKEYDSGVDISFLIPMIKMHAWESTIRQCKGAFFPAEVMSVTKITVVKRFFFSFFTKLTFFKLPRLIGQEFSKRRPLSLFLFFLCEEESRLTL